MAVTITNNGDGTSTFQLQATAATAKVTETLALMAEELWNRGQGPKVGEELKAWEDLSNGEKLAMVNEYLVRIIRSLAENRKRENLVSAAKEAAAIELKEILI